MKYILILVLFCSCSSTFKVNGVEIKQRTRAISHDEKPIFITAFLVGAGLASIYYIPK